MKKKFYLKEKIQQFRAWRERPREVAPMSQEEHECLNCHDHYIGSYCPRCGQAANTSRFSMKVAAENFAEAYGMGERGMFRTILDLILRPGHLILDFLRGKRASYFAPFKMYFLLAAVSLLVTHGLNITGQPLYDDSEATVEEVKKGEDANKTAETTSSFEKDYPQASRSHAIIRGAMDKMERFAEKYPSINILLLLMLISGNLYLFFRHSPNIPDLRYPELFISLVYIANMYTVYSIVFDFFSLTKLASLSIFLTIIPLKQMSGYSWWITLLRTFVAFTIMVVLIIVFIVLAVLGVRLFVEYHG
ncbi:MAG: DUF3667 domain-containing protein [Bacteroidales bacterium]|nr:DUF3667 domain-containing protein [Bacteroidales bacterium]